MSAYDELVAELDAMPRCSCLETFNPDKPGLSAQAAAAIRALEGENFALAAGQCLFDDGTGLTGDEGGTPYCAMKAARQSAEAKLAEAGRLLAILSDEAAVKHGDPHAAQAARAFLASLDKEKAGG